MLLEMRLSAEQVEMTKQKSGYIFDVRAQVCLFATSVKHQHGFTLVELITVMVILGIISVVAIPRFFDQGGYDSRAFHDQVI